MSTATTDQLTQKNRTKADISKVTVDHLTQPKIPKMEISEGEVRSALQAFIASKSCYNSGPAKDMVIKEIIMTTAFRYTLESFCGRKEFDWICEPYNVEYTLDESREATETAYGILRTPHEAFKSYIRNIEVPRTAVVRECNKCTGTGVVRCGTCHGSGDRKCTRCGGSGHDYEYMIVENKDERVRAEVRPCTICNGTTMERCSQCDGYLQIKCCVCEGSGKLKRYLQLTMHWNSYVDEHVIKPTSFPAWLVNGNIIFEERLPRVEPISNLIDVTVNQVSKSLIENRLRLVSTERIIEQRHNVRSLPIAIVNYNWKNKDDSFFVYGLQHRVHFPNYPAKCCCGCTII